MATINRITAEQRERMIAEAAYFLAEKRGFDADERVADWLKAEQEIDATFKLSPHDKKLETLYEQLAEFTEKVREAGTKLKDEARDEWSKDIERIHKLRDGFAEKLEMIRENTGEAKEQAKRQAEKLRRDLAEALKRIGDYPR
jgi:septation ring formation regulator EzrA